MSNEQMNISTIASKRWISRALVSMALRENDLSTATQIVAGASDLFAMYRRQIAELVAQPGLPHSGHAVELLHLLATASAEVEYHQAWVRNLLAELNNCHETKRFQSVLEKTCLDATSLSREIERQTASTAIQPTTVR